MMEKQTSKQIMAEWKKYHLKNSLKIYGGRGRRKPGDGNGMNRGAEKEKGGSSQWLNLLPSESSQVSVGQKQDRRLEPHIGCCLFARSCSTLCDLMDMPGSTVFQSLHKFMSI